jgi:hypothetical protein
LTSDLKNNHSQKNKSESKHLGLSPSTYKGLSDVITWSAPFAGWGGVWTLEIKELQPFPLYFSPFLPSFKTLLLCACGRTQTCYYKQENSPCPQRLAIVVKKIENQIMRLWCNNFCNLGDSGGKFGKTENEL